MPPSNTHRIGSIFAGRYRILKLLGSGGTATVYKCVDGESDTTVALKILSRAVSDDVTTLSRFKNEIEYVRRLQHQNIVQIHELGCSAGDEHYLTMEYIEGKSLQRMIAQKEYVFSVEHTLQILLQIVGALSFAHNSGIVHRDLKPDNVLLTKDQAVKVADFGFARSMDADYGLTATGEAVGTPFYMAPEQFRGENTDPRTDIYALGILAYELAAASRPFAGQTYHSIATSHLMEPIPSLKLVNPQIPAWYQDVVEFCCQKSAKDRFQTMEQVSEELHFRLKKYTVANKHSSPGFIQRVRSAALAWRQ